MWETTLAAYKVAVNDWNKGTGGGSGLETEFQRWDDAKFDKYGIDPNDFDHTIIIDRPLILFAMYSKTREPYLTVIRIWDNMVDNLLCAKYDPVQIGNGEVGMDGSMEDATSLTISSMGSSSTIERKRKRDLDHSVAGLNDVMKSITSLCRL